MTVNIHGLLFPSRTRELADALDGLYRENQTDPTDKARPEERSGNDGKRKGQLSIDDVGVGPVGLEPTTNGLKAPSEDSKDQEES